MLSRTFRTKQRCISRLCMIETCMEKKGGRPLSRSQARGPASARPNMVTKALLACSMEKTQDPAQPSRWRRPRRLDEPVCVATRGEGAERAHWRRSMERAGAGPSFPSFGAAALSGGRMAHCGEATAARGSARCWPMKEAPWPGRWTAGFSGPWSRASPVDDTGRPRPRGLLAAIGAWAPRPPP
jgi:hypothetical protein